MPSPLRASWGDSLTTRRWEAVNLALGAVAPVLVACEMFMYFEETLTPRRMMATQSVTLGLAFAALILDISVGVQKLGRAEYRIIALAIGTVFL